MTFRDSLYGYLTANAPIVAAVGTRIYPDRADQSGGPPYVVYRVVERPFETLDATPPYVDVLIDATAFDVSPEGAYAVAQLLNGALGNFPQGAMGGGVTVLHSYQVEQQPEDSDEFGIFGVRTTFALSYSPA